MNKTKQKLPATWSLHSFWGLGGGRRVVAERDDGLSVNAVTHLQKLLCTQFWALLIILPFILCGTSIWVSPVSVIKKRGWVLDGFKFTVHWWLLASLYRHFVATLYVVVHHAAIKNIVGGGCSVAKLHLTLCNRLDCSTSSFSVPHHLLEFAQIHVLWIHDAIQPSHPVSPSFPSAFNLSQHPGLFKWVGSSHLVAKVLEFKHQSFQWIFRVDFL